MQWDPDHNPMGRTLSRRALQLGLHGRDLMDYAGHSILVIIDLSAFVAEQRKNRSPQRRAQLITALDQVYLPSDPAIRLKLQLAEYTPDDFLELD